MHITDYQHFDHEARRPGAAGHTIKSLTIKIIHSRIESRILVASSLKACQSWPKCQNHITLGFHIFHITLPLNNLQKKHVAEVK